MTRILATLLIALTVLPVGARDLDAIRADGVLRHLGIPYAHFITGGGDGLDMELMQGFAEHLGLRYEYVPTDWAGAFGALTGRNARKSGDGAEWLDAVPIQGDVIANGMTILGWRKSVVDFGAPTFPTGVWLIARADSTLTPIEPTGTLAGDILKVRGTLPGRSVLALPNTCLDPDLYDMDETGAEVRLQPPERQLNEMVPAILNQDAESTMLDVPDALIALERWPGEIKVIGPISEDQFMAPAFRKDSPRLREAFNAYFEELKASGRYIDMVAKYYPAVFRYYEGFFAPN
jgi:ABC-type amino acid transport substrate-binding protein